MTHIAETAAVAQKWASLVETCCPDVARAEWQVGQGDIMITTWFAGREGAHEGTPEIVKIGVDSAAVDEYMHASDVAQFHANGQLIEFVTVQHLRSPIEKASAGDADQWSVTSTDLGLER